MLQDPAPYVRARVARRLGPWAPHVPLEVAAEALAVYPDTKGPELAALVRLVIQARNHRANPNLLRVETDSI